MKNNSDFSEFVTILERCTDLKYVAIFNNSGFLKTS